MLTYLHICYLLFGLRIFLHRPKIKWNNERYLQEGDKYVKQWLAYSFGMLVIDFLVILVLAAFLEEPINIIFKLTK